MNWPPGLQCPSHARLRLLLNILKRHRLAGRGLIHRLRDRLFLLRSDRMNRQPGLQCPSPARLRLRFNILNLSAGRNRTVRSSASKVRTIQKPLVIVASRVSSRPPIQHRFLMLRRFRDQHQRHPPAAAVVTIQIPGKIIELFNQMIFQITSSLQTPSRLSWLRQFRSLAPGFGLALLTFTLPVCASAADEQTFSSPPEAVNALVSTATNHDTNALHLIFGPAGHELISPDVVQATEEYKLFVEPLTEKTELITNSDSNITLQIGADGWPFPIPLVKPSGQSFFDTAAGKEEILARRIGMDEIGAINVCNAYVDADREYASQNRMGDSVLAYAQFLRSTPGTHDGLFWPTNQPGEAFSPLGPLIARR